MKQEFDSYIDNYRKNCDRVLMFSGESSNSIALYKAHKLQEWFSDLQNAHIKLLDFGCGDGVMTAYVGNVFVNAEIIGIDVSVESIEAAKKNHTTNISFHSYEGAMLDFNDDSFDIIFSSVAIHHIPSNEHQIYIKELVRILKPGGAFVLLELNPMNPISAFCFKINPIDKNAKMMPYWYSKKLLESYGAVDIIFYGFFPNFLKGLRKFEQHLSKIPIGALYATILTKK